MNHKQAFGTALREQRTRKRLSQDQLAFEAGLDRTYISLLELGQRSPTLDTMHKLASPLGIKVSTLVLRMENILQSTNDRSVDAGSAD